MANLVAMLRLPSNLKSTQWQILAGPILILLILSMMVLPLPAFVLDLSSQNTPPRKGYILRHKLYLKYILYY